MKNTQTQQRPPLPGHTSYGLPVPAFSFWLARPWRKSMVPGQRKKLLLRPTGFLYHFDKSALPYP